jgi:8-oxo-dGTP pyrophosphatase MutT (NUDIX family)
VYLVLLRQPLLLQTQCSIHHADAAHVNCAPSATAAGTIQTFDAVQVLLHKRQNSGFMDGSYSLVSGHVEANESFKQAMIREAHEEAGR